MLWPIENLDEIYDNIKEQSLSGGCTVIIFVAMDCDALCSCHILTQLFQADNIAYKVKPVNGYEDIEQDYNLLIKDNNTLRSIIMLNCGGDVNLTEKFPVAEETFFYVIDSHRPFHHVNMLGISSQVILFGDDEPETIEAEKISKDLSDFREEDLEEFSEDSESDFEAEFEEEADKHEDRMDIASENDTEQMEKDESKVANSPATSQNNDAASQDVSTAERKKAKLENETESQKRERASSGASEGPMQENRSLKRKRYLEYYRGTFYGQPAAHTAHILAEQINRGDNRSLWLSIVGTTYHYMSGNFSNSKYNLFVGVYHDQVVNSNTVLRSTTTADDGTIIPVAEKNRIEYITELRLMLHRHWSLYDALFYSDYVASRIGIWRANGKSNLLTFLARMGISLKECKQKYSFMSVRVKSKLQEKIREHMEEFQLNDIMYSSFQYQTGFETVVSAADVVYSVQALLEQPKVEKHNDIENTLHASNILRREQEVMEFPKVWLQNFDESYQALSLEHNAIPLLNKGISTAMDLQKAVVHEGISIMEMRLIQSAGDFRYCVLEKLSDLHDIMFSQPQSLTRLAKFVVQMNQSAGKWKGVASKPFILGVKSNRTKYVHFVGLPCSEGHQQEINTFGRQFRLAAKQINAQFKHNGFMSAAVEINAEDSQQFLVALLDVMTTGG